MAKKGSVSFVELHLEKGVLGLAVAFLVFLAVNYLVLEPNRVDFGGEKLGPGQVDEAVKRKAEELKRAVESAKSKAPEVPSHSQLLREQFNAGIFAPPADEASPLPSELKVVAQFGKPLPAFEGDLEASDIALVTPLPPTSLAARTGISLIVREPSTLGEREPIKPVADREAPTELSWVSVAAYFPLEAQEREMTKSGYAGYRSKVYIVGVDVQRQEMTASGEYSEWKDVQSGKAMPTLEVPRPVYDEKTGEVQNTIELDQKLDLVKSHRQALMQPPFPVVDGGDEWDVPPLPGLDAGDEEEESPAAVASKEPPKPPPGGEGGGRTAPGGGGRTPPSGGGRTAPGGGGGGRTAPGGGGRTAPGGGGGGGRTAPSGPSPFGGAQAQEKPDQGKEIREDLKDAKKAVADKDWAKAESTAGAVVRNPDASKAQKNQANKILRDAERGRAHETKSQGRAGRAGEAREPMQLVTNPAKEGEPAVWFHDDSVQPGKTYRYRMRVKLWNRYVGRRSALRDPAQADLPVLAGEWSMPGPPVTVAPKRHFFVRGPNFNEPTATVEVFTWHKGHWLKEDFKVRVGDTIGGTVEMKTGETDKDHKAKKEPVDFGTGAVVLDLRFDEPLQLRRAAGKDGEFAYRDTKSLVLVYMDPADGQVKQRIADVDRSDTLYKKLKDEWDQFRQTL